MTILEIYTDWAGPSDVEAFQDATAHQNSSLKWSDFEVGAVATDHQGLVFSKPFWCKKVLYEVYVLTPKLQVLQVFGVYAFWVFRACKKYVVWSSLGS